MVLDIITKTKMERQLKQGAAWGSVQQCTVIVFPKFSIYVFISLVCIKLLVTDFVWDFYMIFVRDGLPIC